MTTSDILRQLERLGDPQTKKILLRHGAREPLFGVRVADLKTIQRKVKVDHALSLELYDTGNYDAMYLAGLIADDGRMTKRELQRWVDRSYGGISEYIVPWVASQGRFGYELGIKWVGSPKEHVAAAGWHTLSCVAALTPDERLDLSGFSSLLDRVCSTIHESPNSVRSSMNTFIASTGGYILPLSAKALKAAKAVGTVRIDADGTARALTPAKIMIDKMKKRGILGRKRAAVKC